MRLPFEIFKPVSTPLYDFFGCNVHPLGSVELPMIIGCHLGQAKVFTNFLMVDTSLVYNVIIRRPILNALQAGALIYHLVMKFFTAVGVGVIYGNQVDACHCYTLILKEKGNNY